jgi:hypothetical protein
MRLASSTFATAVATFALAGCGSDSSSSSKTATTESSTSALEEVRETRSALMAALASYRSGDRAGAQDQVAEAYVSHFEEAEEPLEKADHELKEQLEAAISRTLRADMKANRPVSAVAARVAAIVRDLDKAEAALR